MKKLLLSFLLLNLISCSDDDINCGVVINRETTINQNVIYITIQFDNGVTKRITTSNLSTNVGDNYCY
jgi:hypothetical protein